MNGQRDRVIDELRHRMDWQALCFFQENQLTAVSAEVDANPVACSDLIRCDQVRQRLYQQSFDSALQVPGTILHVDSFAEQKSLARLGDMKDKRTIRGRIKNALLNHIEFDIENPAQFGLAERAKHNNFVQPVNEFRCELAAG